MPTGRSKLQIRYAPAAVDDMDEAFAYISRDNIAAAEKLLERLDHAITALADFPHMGAVQSDEQYTLVRRGNWGKRR